MFEDIAEHVEVGETFRFLGENRYSKQCIRNHKSIKSISFTWKFGVGHCSYDIPVQRFEARKLSVTLEEEVEILRSALERYMGKFGNCGEVYRQAQKALKGEK